MNSNSAKVISKIVVFIFYLLSVILCYVGVKKQWGDLTIVATLTPFFIAASIQLKLGSDHLTGSRKIIVPIACIIVGICFLLVAYKIKHL